MAEILIGEQADFICNEILSAGSDKNDKYNLHVGAKGYWKNIGVDGEPLWTAFDNTTGDCFVEDFQTELEAISWLEN